MGGSRRINGVTERLVCSCIREIRVQDLRKQNLAEEVTWRWIMEECSLGALWQANICLRTKLPSASQEGLYAVVCSEYGPCYGALVSACWYILTIVLQSWRWYVSYKTINREAWCERHYSGESQLYLLPDYQIFCLTVVVVLFRHFVKSRPISSKPFPVH